MDGRKFTYRSDLNAAGGYVEGRVLDNSKFNEHTTKKFILGTSLYNNFAIFDENCIAYNSEMTNFVEIRNGFHIILMSSASCYE